jgi:hypothetical protein
MACSPDKIVEYWVKIVASWIGDLTCDDVLRGGKSTFTEPGLARMPAAQVVIFG